MKKFVTAILVILLIGGGTYTYIHYRGPSQQDYLAKLLTVEEELSVTKKELFGYTKFTDYLAVSKSTMSEQMKFLAAQVDREYTIVENVRASKLGITSDATIIVKYSAEYSLGYDLKPDSFTITGDTSGITVTLHKPQLVATPAVKILSHEIPGKGIFTDEKAAVIALQQRLPDVAKKDGEKLKNDEAVIALCEKKLSAFLRDFLAKQPNVKVIPSIKFAYK